MMGMRELKMQISDPDATRGNFLMRYDDGDERIGGCNKGELFP